MNRTALTLIACLATLNTATAQRTLEVVESAAEFALSHVDLPASESGTVTIKACGTCPSEFHRVTSATRYVADGRELPLADFVGVADEIRATGNADQRTLVGVFVDRASGNVTRIALLRPR
jgi:hypothetical protein